MVFFCLFAFFDWKVLQLFQLLLSQKSTRKTTIKIVIHVCISDIVYFFKLSSRLHRINIKLLLIHFFSLGQHSVTIKS